MHFLNDAGKDAKDDEDRNNEAYTKYYNVVHFVRLDADPYKPRVRIEGTHIPTKIPVSRLPGPSKPNHRETENKNDKNAAAKINISDFASFIRVSNFKKILKQKLITKAYQDVFFAVSVILDSEQGEEIKVSIFDFRSERTIITKVS